jgi:hypothetical protein
MLPKNFPARKLLRKLKAIARNDNKEWDTETNRILLEQARDTRTKKSRAKRS